MEIRLFFSDSLRRGGVNQSYGIQVARLAGIPDLVIDRAKEILAKIEASHKATQMPKSDIEDKLPETKTQTPKKILKSKNRAQLSLFNTHEKDIVRKLMSIDISNTTPLDALTFLARLQKNAAQ
jgi:DNA mismatch repair protein MutS